MPSAGLVSPYMADAFVLQKQRLPQNSHPIRSTKKAPIENDAPTLAGEAAKKTGLRGEWQTASQTDRVLRFISDAIALRHPPHGLNPLQKPQDR